MSTLINLRAPRHPERVIVDGQSLATFPDEDTNFPAQLMAGRGIPWQNVAVDGFGFLFLAADADERLFPQLRVSAWNVLLLQGGQADVAGSDTAAQAFGRVTAYADAARAYATSVGTGLYIINTTMPPSVLLFPTLGALETKRLDYNQLIRGDGGAHFDAVVDLVADARLQDSTNTTYFADLLHPTAAGAAVIAELLDGPLDTALAAAA